jgi:hypothetical protein
MKTWVNASAVVAVGLMLASGTALGQPKPADCPKPEMVAGQIVSIDTNQGKLTVQGADGKKYEFNASKEVLADKKVGDRIEVTKRPPEGCK